MTRQVQDRDESVRSVRCVRTTWTSPVSPAPAPVDELKTCRTEVLPSRGVYLKDCKYVTSSYGLLMDTSSLSHTFTGKTRQPAEREVPSRDAVCVREKGRYTAISLRELNLLHNLSPLKLSLNTGRTNVFLFQSSFFLNIIHK